MTLLTLSEALREQGAVLRRATWGVRNLMRALGASLYQSRYLKRGVWMARRARRGGKRR